MTDEPFVHPLPDPQPVTTEAYRRALAIAVAARREFIAKLEAAQQRKYA